MSLAIVGKVGATLLLVSTSSIAVVLVIDPEQLGVYSNAYMYAISTAATVKTVDATAGTAAINKDNFECKLTDGSKLLDCEIFKPKTSTTEDKLEWIDYFSSESESANHLLSAEHKVFQIKFSGKYWDKLQVLPTSLEIVSNSTTSTTPEKKYASLKPIFATYKTKTSGKTSYFIASQANPAVVSLDQTDKKCKWLIKDQDTQTKECEIFDLAAVNAAQKPNTPSAFTKTTTKSTKIDTAKYYLIKFTTELKNNAIPNFTDLHYKKESDDASPTTFKHITPAFYGDNYENVFVF